MGDGAGRYHPRAAPPGLASLLVCRWDATMAGAVDMAPDGCVELMWLDGAGLIVCGPETIGWSAVHQRPVEASGVRLRPGVARTVLGVPVGELTDRRVRLDDVLPVGLVARTLERVQRAGAQERSTALVDLVRMRLRGATPSDMATGVCGSVERSDGIGKLADSLGITTRHLHRRCVQEFGYGPATLRRILRLQRFLALRKANPRAGLAQLAVAAGYADQAHLSHDARQLTGLAPTSLLGSPQADWHGEGSVVGVRSVQDAS